jgi:NAD(P)-dependent dehydrogenase (short-subunit alcohol dehydrogenase family)
MDRPISLQVLMAYLSTIHPGWPFAHYKRLGKPSEVASVVLLLATNDYITGQTFNVNGGWYVN